MAAGLAAGPLSAANAQRLTAGPLGKFRTGILASTAMPAIYATSTVPSWSSPWCGCMALGWHRWHGIVGMVEHRPPLAAVMAMRLAAGAGVQVMSPARQPTGPARPLAPRQTSPEDAGEGRVGRSGCVRLWGIWRGLDGIVGHDDQIPGHGDDCGGADGSGDAFFLASSIAKLWRSDTPYSYKRDKRVDIRLHGCALVRS
jgi:hypothetical protein